MNFKLTRRGHSFKLNGNVLRHHFRTNKFLFNGVFKPFEAHANSDPPTIFNIRNGEWGTGIGERGLGNEEWKKNEILGKGQEFL